MMQHKKILAIVLVLAGGLGLWLSARMKPHTALNDRLGYFPKASVFLVTIDTTRADRLGAYGSKAGLTPFLDRLASEGVVFEQAEAVAPLTLPSHTSILTGLLPIHHGVRNNGMFSLPPDVETLAESYSQAGYATGGFISAQVLVHRYGLNRGFDLFDDDLSQSRKTGQTMVPSRRGDLTLEKAEAWLQSVDQNTPVFMWLHLYDPHAPYSPPIEYQKKFPTDPYGGEIAFADDLVRRLSESIEKSGRLDNSIITVLADHGESLGEHGEATHGILLHQATIHVPWILVTPRRSESMRVRKPVSTVDVPAVLAALTGITPPNASRLDARSDFLGNGKSDERVIYYEAVLPYFQYGWSPLRGLRKGPWEIIHGKRDEIFNLGYDPRELSDLRDNNPMELKYFREKINGIVAADTGLNSESIEKIKPSEREALEALGYVGTTAAERPDPPDPRDLVVGHVHVESSRELMAAGRYDAALKEIDVMLKEDPGNLSALSMKAQVEILMGRTDEAEEILKEGLALDPKNSDIVAGLCRIEWARKNFEKVIELSHLGRNTRSPFGTFDALEAKALQMLDRDDEASTLLDQSLKNSPDDADLLVARAILQWRHHEIDAAKSDLRHAVEVDPFHLPARKNLGQLLLKEGKAEEAMLIFEEMLRIDPRDTATLETLGSLKMNSDPSGAIPFLEEAVRLAPGRVQYLSTLGVAYLKVGKTPEAEANLRRALSLSPKDPNIRNNLSIAMIQSGHYREAVALLRPLLKEHPNLIRARNNLAVAVASMGNLKEAEREAHKVLQADPAYTDGIMTLAAILHQGGRYQEEFDLLEEKADAASADPSYLRKLGIAAGLSSHCARALEILKPLVSTKDHPVDPELLQVAAGCMTMEGDPEAARGVLSRLLQDPKLTSSEKTDLRARLKKLR